jgi:hypothetical protein
VMRMQVCATSLALSYRKWVAENDWVELFAAEDNRSSIMVGASVFAGNVGRSRSGKLAGPDGDRVEIGS